VRVIEADSVRAISRRWRLQGPARLINTAQVREMKSQGVGATEIAKALGIGRATVYPGVGTRPMIPELAGVIERLRGMWEGWDQSMCSNVVSASGRSGKLEPA